MDPSPEAIGLARPRGLQNPAHRAMPQLGIIAALPDPRGSPAPPRAP